MLGARDPMPEEKGEIRTPGNFQSFDELRKKYSLAAKLRASDTLSATSYQDNYAFTRNIDSISSDNYDSLRPDHFIPLMNLAIEINKLPDNARANALKIYHNYLKDFNFSRVFFSDLQHSPSLAGNLKLHLDDIDLFNDKVFTTWNITRAINSLRDQQHKVRWINILSDSSRNGGAELLNALPWTEIGDSFSDIHESILSYMTELNRSSSAISAIGLQENLRQMFVAIKASNLSIEAKINILKVLLNHSMISTAIECMQNNLGITPPLPCPKVKSLDEIESLIEIEGVLLQLQRLKPQEEIEEKEEKSDGPQSAKPAIAYHSEIQDVLDNAGAATYEAGKDEVRKMLSDEKMSLASIILIKDSAQAVADAIEKPSIEKLGVIAGYKQKIESQPKEQSLQNIGKGFKSALEMFAVATFLLIVVAVASTAAPVNLILGVKIASALLGALGITSVAIPCWKRNDLLTPYSRALGLFAPIRDTLDLIPKAKLLSSGNQQCLSPSKAVTF